MKTMLALPLVLLLASNAAGYPGEDKYLSSKALDSYKGGNYEKAEELYSKALDKSSAKPKPRLKYNLGGAQLKSGKISKALESYQEVYDETDTALNAAARYNAGVAHHSLARKALEATGQAPGMQGTENAQDMARQTAIRELESALKQYRSALSAAPADNDMKFNYELARRELELLKLQQQQQQQQQQNKDKDQQQDQQQQQQQQQQQNKDDKKDDQQQQQDQQKNDQQQQPQPQNSDQNKDKPDEQKSGEQQQQEQKREEQQKKEQEKKDDKQQQGGQPRDGKGQEEPPPGEMSQEDVERLLNSLPPENQQALQRFFNIPLRSGGKMEKDW